MGNYLMISHESCAPATPLARAGRSLGGLGVLLTVGMITPASGAHAQTDYYNLDRGRPLRVEDALVIELLEKKGKTMDFDFSETVIQYLPGDPGILEVRARRGRGLAYRISRHIADQGWNILGARVGQWAGQSTASFTLAGPNGRQLEPEEVSKAFSPKV